MVASFHCYGTSPPVHTSTRMAWKRSRTMGSAGSSILSSSATRESGPGAFQLCIPRIARLVSSSVGADPSGTESPVVGAAGHCYTSSMMAGFSLGDVVLRRVLKNLAHRWRIWTNYYAPLFPTPTIGMKWACTLTLLIAMQGHQKNSKNKTDNVVDHQTW